MTKNILVVAPHPDDEVLGVGGTMAKFSAAGDNVYVVIVTRGYPPAFEETLVATSRREAREAHALLGVRETFFLDFPAASLDEVPHAKLNAALANLVKKLDVDIMFIPFVGDIHADHQLVFLSSLVAVRPSNGSNVTATYAYETLSETNWNAPYLAPAFHPNVFIDISAELPHKIEAMKTFASQIRPFPHERSAEALRALATLRGATIGTMAAEAFVLIRHVLR